MQKQNMEKLAKQIRTSDQAVFFEVISSVPGTDKIEFKSENFVRSWTFRAPVQEYIEESK